MDNRGKALDWVSRHSGATCTLRSEVPSSGERMMTFTCNTDYDAFQVVHSLRTPIDEPEFWRRVIAKMETIGDVH